jgi:hypothetical protein
MKKRCKTMEIVMRDYNESEIKNSEILEVFSNGNYDKKSKINLSDNQIPKEFITEIEHGNITSEMLSEVAKNHIIRKYRTQITVHGIFDEINIFNKHDYKFTFKNKNGSTGIKWCAIDRKKRCFIAKYLRNEGISYSYNSSSHGYSCIRFVDEKNYTENHKELVEKLNKFKKVEFFGDANIYTGSIYGSPILFLKVVINAISNENVEKLLNEFGYTPGKREEIELEEKRKEEKRKVEAEKREEEEKRKVEASKKEILVELKKVGYTPGDIKKYNETGLYIRPTVNWSGDKEYKLIRVYSLPRKRKLRKYIRKFNNLSELFKYIKDNTENELKSYNDTVLNGNVKGIRI